MAQHHSLKVLRHHLLRFINTSLGLCLAVCLVFFCAFSALNILSSFFHNHTKHSFNNIGNVDPSVYNFPEIDAVYTWVNGSDPVHFSKRSLYLKSSNKTVTANRFREFNELLYSLRSLETYAPWIRKVFIITDQQVPHWLNTRHPKVKIIDHSDLFPFELSGTLPVFSSPAIESQFYRLDELGVSPHFLYFNDDFFLGSPLLPSDLITPRGQAVFLTWPVPECSPGCSSQWLGDGRCDSACNNEDCGFDDGDCEGVDPDDNQQSNFFSWNSFSTSFSQNNRYCSTGCFVTWIGDGYCDSMCNNRECGYDGGDCVLINTDLESDVVGVEKDLIGDVEVSIDSRSVLIDVDVSVNDTLSVKWIALDFDLDGESSQSFALDCIWTCLYRNDANLLTIVLHQRESLSDSLKELAFLGFNSSLSFNHEVILYNEQTGYETKFKLTVLLPDVEETDDVTDDVITQTDDVSSPFAFTTTSESDSEPDHVIDYYSDSLKFVDRLLVKSFGPANRRVPAHMPYFVQLNILKDIHQTFPTELDSTATHRFRDSTDVQFSLMYYSFLQEAKRPAQNGEYFFKFYDVDGDGKLCHHEVRRFLADIFDPVTHRSIDWLSNVTTGQTNFYPAEYLANVTDLFQWIWQVVSCRQFLNTDLLVH
ncbi:hypothetical protein GEMRC1_003946 [Eukaryota sp. GEM-RC1]